MDECSIIIGDTSTYMSVIPFLTPFNSGKPVTKPFQESIYFAFSCNLKRPRVRVLITLTVINHGLSRAAAAQV